jgi:ribosomal protein S18 acetylase RimI-like enzyme
LLALDPATGALLGFAVFHATSLAVHLVRVAVAPAARRRGVGGALLQVRSATGAVPLQRRGMLCACI